MSWRKFKTATSSILLMLVIGCGGTAVNTSVKVKSPACPVSVIEAYKFGYEDGVRDAVNKIKEINQKHYKETYYKRVRIPGSVVGNTYLPTHDEYIVSPQGAEPAFDGYEMYEMGNHLQKVQ